MKGDRSQFVQKVMSGADGSARAGILRAGLAVAESVYAGVMGARNWMYDRGLKRVRRLPRPVISVGNITTGGTGKTPVVRWVSEQLRGMGKRPAILSRGYKSEGGGLGDELTMLDRALNQGQEERVFLAANADRVAGAESVLREHPEVDVFVLDDAFQHRRVARDLDVVLISAANPFGYGHVLPRGLLRERLSGLARADAFIITHADQGAAEDLEGIERTIRKLNNRSMILRAIHAQTGLRTSGGVDYPMEELVRRKFFAFAGIANPASFEKPLRAHGELAGRHWFGDHHDYRAGEIRSLREEAKAAGAEVLVTTEKDWVKVAGQYQEDEGMPPIWRVAMELRFLGQDGEKFASTLKAATN